MDYPSNRTTTLHNIDEIFGNSALTMDKWKLLNGTTYAGEYDGWYGPAGDRGWNNNYYDTVRQSDAGSIMFELGYLPDLEEIR